MNDTDEAVSDMSMTAQQCLHDGKQHSAIVWALRPWFGIGTDWRGTHARQCIECGTIQFGIADESEGPR